MAAKSASWLYERRQLKRPRLGPADVYPQEIKQREDELTATNVKQGFAGSPTILDEYASARNSNITSNRFGAWFSALLAKKQELNTLLDVPKRKPQTGKDQLWLVTPRNQVQADAWFRDLANGSKPLSLLSKKVPILNKREEVLSKLCEVEVPMYKAAFYIKAHYAHTTAMAESGNKSKKRQIPDPAVDWTSTLCKQLREVFTKLHEQYKAQDQSSSLSSLTSPTKIESADIKHWSYFTQLARHMFEQHLLEKHDFLSWLLEVFERIKSPDDLIIRLVLIQLVNYSEDFAEFELLSRKLAYYCCRKLNQLLGDNYTQPSDLPSESDDQEVRSVAEVPEALKCPGHRGVVIGLSAIVQIITLKCKTALVWHYQINEGKIPASLTGSPLDHLSCPPSSLPMSKRAEKPETRKELKEAEEEIRLRSCAVENKWASERLQRSNTGTSTSRSLQTLEALDRHFFDKVESHNSLDTLYMKIFRGPVSNSSDDDDSGNERSLSDILKQDESTVKLLCEWAVTTKRSGEHRSLYVAKLLERRQNEITCQNEGFGDENPPSVGPESPARNQARSGSPNGFDGNPVFQSVLLSFLDHQAPVLDEKSSKSDNKIAFSNLVLLFGELIRCEVFSHDAYMCTLISRGYFTSTPSGSLTQTSDTKSATSSGLGSFGQSASGAAGHSGPSHSGGEGSLPMFDPLGPSQPKTEALSWDTPQMDMDDDRIDADLDKLLQHITAKGAQSNLNDQTDILLPDSTPPEKDEDGNVVAPGDKNLAARHMLYTTHFPIPQDDSTLHECNQRLVLLYGVGKARDEAKHAVKKVTKEIMKLFSRKASMDISDGGKVKKSATKDGFNFEIALTRFQSLPFYDQSVVTSSCASTCIEMLNGVAKGESNYLPLVESIAFLFDLMEMAFNVHGMIEFIIQLLKELEDIDKQILVKCPSLKSSYTSSIGLYVVGLLFRFQSCLVVSLEEVLQVFEGCIRLVKHVQNPADCSSPERCILGYLFDLYYSVHPLKTKTHEPILSIIPILSKVKGVIYGQINPSILNLFWNNGYMMECLTNPKSKVDPCMVRQLNENPNLRYSFVCNAVKQIAIARDANLINELSILCAELSARCPPLSADWIGVLKALCCSSNHTCGFMDSLTKQEVADTGIHDNLAIFTSILVARRCFSLQDFVIHCALPSLLAACPQGGGDSEAEPGARLTCHLLLCLFRTSDPPLSSAPVISTPATTLYSLTSPGPNNLFSSSRPSYIIKHPCDRYLLAAAHTRIRVEAVIAALKAILVLGDANEGNNRDGANKTEVNVRDLLSHIDDDDDFGMPLSRSRSDNMEVAGLGEFAKMALRQICSQEWVHDKCLRDPEMLCKPDLLLDTMLTPKQARQLLEMICRPKATVPSTADSEFDQKAYITQILHSLDEWTLRVSWLQLNLMYAQCSSLGSSEVSNWLENVARSTIDFFQNAIEDSPRPSSSSRSINSKGGTSKSSPASSKLILEPSEVKEARVWLVAPLISKLPATLQGKILRVAANVLESGNWMNPPSSSTSYSSSSKNKDRFSTPKSNANSSATALLSYSPFMSLVLMCLKGQDEQRESLLKSLYSQLEQAVEQKPSDDLKVRNVIQEGLQLRLSLVGGMLDVIQKSSTTLSEWTLLLRNLIENVVVEPQLNYELFTIVIDIMTLLIHSTHTSDTLADAKDEPRKHYHNLMKKLRKDFPVDRSSYGMQMLKQLIPISKNTIDVIVCEPMGSLIDTKGNKIAGFDSIDKKQGLQVAEKQKVPAWEIIEGSKNPAPLLWSWFGAVHCERKPLKCDEVINALEWHSHSMRKPTSYYLESPPLPPEDEPEPTPLPTPTQTLPPAIPTPMNIPQPITSIPIIEQKMTSIPAPVPPMSNTMGQIHQQMQQHQPPPQPPMQQHHHLQQQLSMPPQPPQPPMNVNTYQPMSSYQMQPMPPQMQQQMDIPESVPRAKPGPKPKQQRKKRTPKNQQQPPPPSQTPPVRPPSSGFDPQQGYGAPHVAVPNQGMSIQPPQPGSTNWGYNQQNLNQGPATQQIPGQSYYQGPPSGPQMQPQLQPQMPSQQAGKRALGSMLRAKATGPQQGQQIFQQRSAVPRQPRPQGQLQSPMPGMVPMNQGGNMYQQQQQQSGHMQQIPIQGQQGYMHQQSMSNYGDQVPVNQIMDQSVQHQHQMGMNQSYPQQQQMVRSQQMQQQQMIQGQQGMMQQQPQTQYMARNDFNPGQRGQYNPNVTVNQMNAGVQYNPRPTGMLQRQLSQGQPMNHYQQQQQQPGQYGQS